jgi:hypothetical protein
MGMERWWNDTDMENKSTRTYSYPSGILSIRNPPWTRIGWNPDLCGKKSPTNHLNYGTTHWHSHCYAYLQLRNSFHIVKYVFLTDDKNAS